MVASFPVIKILIITAIGLCLALDNINLLGKDARIQVNHVSKSMNSQESIFFPHYASVCIDLSDNSDLSVTACTLCV